MLLVAARSSSTGYRRSAPRGGRKNFRACTRTLNECQHEMTRKLEPGVVSVTLPTVM